VSQVAKNKQLLDIAEDCFQFTTNFFEVINVSAPHIYHSALELSPVSSIIRKLYYHRRVTRLPRVVIGTPESWARTIAISGKEEYDGTPIWSPCGRFVAAQTRSAVEIRNQLTLELITILQPPETTPHLTGPLSYSPDGRSIAHASDTTIMIWDIQTGGVAKEIKRSANTTSLVWSSDGRTICTIDSKDPKTFTVHTYDVSSGTISSPGTLQSRNNPHLWMVDRSFWVMTTGYPTDTLDVFEVGFTLTKIQSFPPRYFDTKAISFSPATHHISVSNDKEFFIFDIRNPSEILLCELDNFLSYCFSSDGSLFAASQENVVCVWKYDSGFYTLCWEFHFRGLYNPLRFSPTPSSILGHSKKFLRVWRLHEPPTSPETRRQQYVGLSRSGTRVAIAYKMERTVTIADLLAQTPPQFIDADMEIHGLVLTGNVLLVTGSDQVVAWLLTEEGLVGGIIGDSRVGYEDRIWNRWKPAPAWGIYGSWMFLVEGQVGVVGNGSHDLHVYHTETGKVLDPAQAPQHFDDRWSTLAHSWGYCSYKLSQGNTPPEGRWPNSQAALRNGWVKDPEGKHRLWVPVEWRMDWDPADWRHDVTIQFGALEDRLVLIKF